MQDQEKINGDVDLLYFTDKPIRSGEAITPARRDIDINLTSQTTMIPSTLRNSAIAVSFVLAISSTTASERPLPPTWWALANSVNSEDLGLVKSLRSMNWFDACADWGKGVKANLKTRRQAAIQLMLESDGMINNIDLEYVKNKNIEIGMTTCGIIASIGKPDINNTITTTSQTRAQMVYRSRKIYVYTDAKRNGANGTVTAIQR